MSEKIATADTVVKKVGRWVSFVVSFQAFLKQIWKYLALIFAGVIAGLVYGMKQIKPIQHIQTDEFINEQSRDLKIEKIKQRGEGNTMELDGLTEMTQKEIRQERRAKRRAERQKKKDANSVLSEVETNHKI